ncbi:MAG TPA: CBS domain-containing protein, partial [Actinomycetota bacterium]|nr:CBS domain-containing protein [Actinomycetota bacterium]
MNDMKVKDVMTNLVVMLYPRDTIREASQRLARNRVSGAPVVVDGKVVGIVSESDLIHASMPPVHTAKGMSVLEILSLMGRGKLPVHDHEGSVEDIMSSRVITVRPQASIWAAAELMERHGVKRLPVTDENGCLLGIISRADLVRAMSRGDRAIRTDVLAEADILGRENFDDLE